jgi:hypothetical protein
MGDTVSRYAIRVRPRHEKSGELSLGIAGDRLSSAPVSTRRKWADRNQACELPVFPGYILRQFAANQQELVLRTPGVIDVVRRGNTPASILCRGHSALKQLDASGCEF